MEQIPRVVGKVTVSSRKRGSITDSGPSHTHVLHEFLFTAGVFMPRVRENDELVLVGFENKWGKVHSRDQMGYLSRPNPRRRRGTLT